jgi:hypothetical protein
MIIGGKYFMRERKRFITKLGAALLFILVGVVMVIVISNIMYEKLQNEQKMVSDYEKEKESCELLKNIAKETIKEGVGIDTRTISNDEIQYRIYNDNEKIIYYYYLIDESIKDDSTAEPKYNATITLSNEYKILKEEYSDEIESLTEYSKSYTFMNRLYAIIYGILFWVCFYLLIYILINVILFFIRYIKRKNERL